jgi:hypothetical protein
MFDTIGAIGGTAANALLVGLSRWSGTLSSPHSLLRQSPCYSSPAARTRRSEARLL